MSESTRYVLVSVEALESLRMDLRAAGAALDTSSALVRQYVHGALDAANALGSAEASPELPPLRPMFQRLAELSPDWVMKGPSPCHKEGVTEWAIDGVSSCDADWMHAHMSLRRSVIDTIAGLGWAFYTVRPKGGVLVQREAVVKRGKTAYEEHDFGQVEEVWVHHGEHRAKGPTDLHALLAALIEALEAHAKAEVQQ